MMNKGFDVASFRISANVTSPTKIFQFCNIQKSFQLLQDIKKEKSPFPYRTPLQQASHHNCQILRDYLYKNTNEKRHADVSYGCQKVDIQEWKHNKDAHLRGKNSSIFWQKP